LSSGLADRCGPAHSEGPAREQFPVQGADGDFRLRRIFEFNESESAWLAGGVILHELYSAGFESLSDEPLGERFFGFAEWNIAYKKSVQMSPPSGLLTWAGENRCNKEI
jgi:hypothetical protein